MFIVDKDSSGLETGEWADFKGARFKLKHVSNIDFQRAVLRLQQPYRRKIDAGTLDPKISRDIVCQAMSQHILIDWELVFDKTKKPVLYSQTAAFAALVGNEDLRDFVSAYSTDIDNFIKEDSVELGKD